MEANNTLNWLFAKYLENPNAVWNIIECHEAFTTVEKIHEHGIYLVKKGFVKKGECHDEGFNCSITTLGILQVSTVLNDVKYQILEASVENQKTSIVEILQAHPSHFRKVQDYALYLKQLGIIECIFQHNDVLAKPTLFGKEWYYANKQIN
jgi:hypothetical protein